jgi:hypothetical protein
MYVIGPKIRNGGCCGIMVFGRPSGQTYTEYEKTQTQNKDLRLLPKVTRLPYAGMIQIRFKGSKTSGSYSQPADSGSPSTDLICYFDQFLRYHRPALLAMR